MIMQVVFWGVRGTFPAVGAEYARYGGDTMCIEVLCGEVRVILDAGSGLRALGAKLNAQEGPVAADIILSHLHLDHIMGLNAFAPFLREDARITIHAPQECLEADGSALASMIRPPLSPFEAGALAAAIEVQEFNVGDGFYLGGEVNVRTVAASHQGPCAAVIVSWQGRKLCYVTDHEHGQEPTDEQLMRAIEGADLLIYDATFSDAEMVARRGWGHSSWQEGVRLKRRAGVGLLALAHHEPERTDPALDAFAEMAAAQDPNVFFARQGLRLSL